MSRLTSPACAVRSVQLTVFGLAVGVLLSLGGFALAASGADETSGEIPEEARLAEIGADFEKARLHPDADQIKAISELDQSLSAIDRGRLESDRRSAARFLAGEIRYELGDLEGALEAFDRAKNDGEPFADDAAFARVQALEAADRDPEAAEEWVKWEKRYADSPLMSEARVARVWNALRQGKSAQAEKLLAELTAAYPWLARDWRVVLATATVLYLDGRPAEALAGLGTSSQGAAATYLRALCHDALGVLLKAAATYQEVVERHPHSPLSDHAMFAKANIFLTARDYRSAAQEFSRVAERVRNSQVRAEAELRGAASVFLSGAPDSSLVLLRRVVERHRDTDVAARAQFLVGEVEVGEERYTEAIVDLNRVLTEYFHHSVAASAQYRVARCLDALGRYEDATSAYQAVVSGYPLEPEAPAAAYLAGVGLMNLERPLAAAPYFQLVLDRYASATNDSSETVVFASPEHQELVEAALCLLELSYHRAGNLGQLSGAPHLLLERMPPSRSEWRAYALLIDADASAAQGRYSEAEAMLGRLFDEFPDHSVGASANKLLAWTYARQGRDAEAIATEERLIARYQATGNAEDLNSAYLNIAHSRFNQKDYSNAATSYEDFLERFPEHPDHLVALYQAGLCYMRLDRAGDAVDRWETIVRESADAAIAERAWVRAGDLYFQAERYDDAKRCYQGLLAHFDESSAASVAMLRLAQCEYNAGNDAEALEAFSKTITRYPGTGAAREAARGTELALYRLGQTPGGTEVLAKLVEEYPNSAFAADAQFRVARQKYDEKQFAEAAELFRRVVSQFPGYSAADQAHFLMADSYAQLAKGEEALAAYEQFLIYFPDSPLRASVKFRLGMIHFEAEDHMQAAIAFTGLLGDSLSTEMAAASLFNLALCQRLLGLDEEALTSFERYRRDYPGDERVAHVSHQLGDLYDSAGKPAEAAVEFARALAAGPDPVLEVELNYRVGQCREQLADTEGALSAYKRAVASKKKTDPFRLSAVARCAAIYEGQGNAAGAVKAYRDIAKHSPDPELVAVASERASQLEQGAVMQRSTD
jgi:TolA-binding protein